MARDGALNIKNSKFVFLAPFKNGFMNFMKIYVIYELDIVIWYWTINESGIISLVYSK